MSKNAKNAKKNYIYAVGRRKEASARVRLYKGEGEGVVNGLPWGVYFQNPISKAIWEKPFELTGTLGKYNLTARVVGGGKEAQLQAAVHAIAKALAQEKKEYRNILKKAGLLTRDARVRERRKVGTGGKARRLKQSPKR